MTQFHNLKELIFGKLEIELPQHLSYHNIDHTIDVMQAAESIAEKEGIGEDDKRLLHTAALLHDVGFLSGRDGHEAASCAIAREYLPVYGYGPDEIETICSLIMATRIPQLPQNKLEEILCDADLDYLGRDDFFIMSQRLFNELQAEGIVNNEDNWNRQQAAFMEEYKYFTNTSRMLRQGRREQHIKIMKSKIPNQISNEDR
ncbi:MAG: HD domain-containing protein [Sphingobacteriales bacterium]